MPQAAEDDSVLLQRTPGLPYGPTGSIALESLSESRGSRSKRAGHIVQVTRSLQRGPPLYASCSGSTLGERVSCHLLSLLLPGPVCRPQRTEGSKYETGTHQKSAGTPLAASGWFGRPRLVHRSQQRPFADVGGTATSATLPFRALRCWPPALGRHPQPWPHRHPVRALPTLAQAFFSSGPQCMTAHLELQSLLHPCGYVALAHEADLQSEWGQNE